VRGILLLLYLFAAGATMLFLVLTLVYAVLAGWALWEHQITAFGAMVVLGALTGYVAVRMLFGLGDSFIRWHRQYPAGRDLPRATVVSR
jgi:hypothetical protein